jgi:hypothetical protein
MRTMIAASCLLAGLASAIPVPASAYPAGAWRTRNTGLTSEGQCTRRAFKAVKAANLDGKASAETGVVGTGHDVLAYVICTNGGRFAVIFCASDRPNGGQHNGEVCDIVARYMEN